MSLIHASPTGAEVHGEVAAAGDASWTPDDGWVGGVAVEGSGSLAASFEVGIGRSRARWAVPVEVRVVGRGALGEGADAAVCVEAVPFGAVCAPLVEVAP